MLLLEQDIIRKKQVDKNNIIELDIGNNKKYKIEAIYNSMVYAKESKLEHQLGFYYLVLWKKYLEKENTWELALAIQHFRKLINFFYKNYFDNSITISESIAIASLMIRPIIKPTNKPNIKQKQDQLANSTNKEAKNN